MDATYRPQALGYDDPVVHVSDRAYQRVPARVSPAVGTSRHQAQRYRAHRIDLSRHPAQMAAASPGQKRQTPPDHSQRVYCRDRNDPGRRDADPSARQKGAECQIRVVEPEEGPSSGCRCKEAENEQTQKQKQKQQRVARQSPRRRQRAFLPPPWLEFEPCDGRLQSAYRRG